MDDRSPQSVIGRQVDAVGQQPVVAGQPLQPPRRVDIDGPFADVDVDADPQVPGQAGGVAQGFVSACERGVDADQAPAAGPDEPLVLLDAAAFDELIPPEVAADPLRFRDEKRYADRLKDARSKTGRIRDPVGGHDPHADLGAGGGDRVEAALDGVGGLVVVDDGRGAALECLQRPQHGGPADHLQVEGGVEAPPDLLQYLSEVGGDPRRGRHPPRQRRVEMVVGAHQAGRDRGHGYSPPAPVRARRGTAARAAVESRIGRLVRHFPSNAWRAPATAPRVGTSTASPAPLAP